MLRSALARLTGQVSLSIDFQDEADQPLIRDFNLEVNPGEMVRYCRPNRCRKSTMINLLSVSRCVGCSIFPVDGHDIRNYHAVIIKIVWWCF